MIRVLMWKEYREHRAIWLTLAVVSGGGLFGLSRLMGPVWGLSSSGARESLQTVAVLFAWTYGLVCGAMLLANENESGTMTFLDILPVRRLQLWLIKYVFGLILLLSQVAVLFGFVAGLDIAESTAKLIIILLAMLFSGFFSLSWGLLFSARGENVLNVIGLAFLAQIAAVLLTSAAIAALGLIVSAIWGGNSPQIHFLLLVFVTLALTVGPALVSARLYTQLDRDRRLTGWLPSGVRRPETMNVLASWGRLLWLSGVQMRRLMLGLSVFALVLGCFLPLIGPAGWPTFSLLFGVLCGVTVWSDEQLSGAFRFLGDQRFPLGRVWIVKIGTRFALAVFAAWMLLLPSLVLALIHQFASPSLNDRIPFFADLLHCSLVGPIVPVFSHLLLWLLYGFTAGQLCGMLFRKSLVAGVVALGSAGMFVCLWLPSMLGIGLHFWQVAGAPLCLLAAGWFLMPAWAADRLLARGTFVRLGLALFAAGLWTAGGLWYRVAEIPDVPEPYDMPAFKTSIPPLDKGKNDAGLAIRTAWNDVDQMAQSMFEKRTGKPLFPKWRVGDSNDTFNLEINAVLKNGWPGGSSELGDWLNDKFEGTWYCNVLEAAFHPIGVVEDPRQLNFFEPIGRGHVWGNLGRLNQILAVRGLQRQTDGDHWTFVDNLRISLALSRNLQHRAPPFVAVAGRSAEMFCVAALDRWLEKLPNYPDLLESARDILLQHEAQLPPESDPNVASYLIAQNTLGQVPENLVETQIFMIQRAPRSLGRPDHRKSEIDTAALFWRIPWEQERHQRILRHVFRNDPQHGLRAKPWSVAAFSQLRQRELGRRRPHDLALLHAAQLKVALRLYQSKNHGKLPQTLNDLVPRYLPAVPLDPFDDQPFRYRVSDGERLGWYEDPPLRPVAGGGGGIPAGGVWKQVPRGQAILWSVDEDKEDNAGKNHRGNGGFVENTDTDLIYLVPLPPR